jgi:multiple sugar transport system permease protein
MVAADLFLSAFMAGAVVLAAPVAISFIVLQRYFVASDLGSGVKG